MIRPNPPATTLNFLLRQLGSLPTARMKLKVSNWLVNDARMTLYSWAFAGEQKSTVTPARRRQSITIYAPILPIQSKLVLLRQPGFSLPP